MAGKSVSFVVKGPIVEGKTAPLVADMIRDVDRAVADDLLDRWRHLLRQSVRHWTGAYGRRMTVLHGPKQSKVTDGGSVYGPWLEGTSRRNKATRFKGYAAQRRAKQEAERASRQLAQQVVSHHVGRFE